MSSSESVPAAPDRQLAGPHHWVVFAMCAAAALAYLQRNCIGVAESTIRAELDMTRQQMGWVLGGFFFFSYSLFQIPAGWLGPRLGPRKALSAYAAVWSLATVAIALAGSGILAAQLAPAVMRLRPGLDSAAAMALVGIWWLYAARVAGGLAQAGLFPCSAIIISHWIPQTKRAAVTGWIGGSQQVGAIAAAGLTGLLLGLIGWRTLFVLFALPGLIWAWAFWRWFRNRPEEYAATSTIASDVAGTEPELPDADIEVVTPTPWLALLLSPPMWWICGQQFCRGAGYIFYASWFPTFLQETRGVTVARSGLLTMLPLLASLIGVVSAGTISDWMLAQSGSLRSARRNIAVFGMLGCAALIFVAYFVENPNAVVLVISGGAFCASLAGPSGYATTIDMGGRHVATIFGTMNMAGNVGAAIFPIIVPLLQSLPGGWNLVLVVFGGVYAAAALFWMLLNPVGTFAESSLLPR